MKKLVSLFLALALSLGLCVPALAVEFSDVPASHAFHDAIADCSEKGIVGGYSDGTFRPTNTVTRSNFVVMLSRAFYPDDVAKYSTESNLKYGYATPSFVTLNYKGILTGTNFDTIEKFITPEIVNQGISRYDMALLMTNIMNDKGFAASSAEKSAVISQIADYSEIPSQYKDAVTNVYALGIIGGYSNGTFGGTVTMNRGQAAVVIHRLAQYIGIDTSPVLDPSANPNPAEVPNSPSSTTKPETAITTKTLVDGSAITEANVMRLMEARVAEWGNQKWGTESGPNGTPTSKPYPQGDTGDVRVGIQHYRDPYGLRCSCAAGCGGWATYLSDAAFGTTGFPLRKVTSVDDIRAGDIEIMLKNGVLQHVDIVSGKTNVRNFGSYDITFHGTYSANAGTVPGHSANGIDPTRAEYTTNYDSTTGVSRVFYTRYPN